MFQVVVAAGVSLVACGSEQGPADASANAPDGAGAKDATTVPDVGPGEAGSGDAGAADASSDAIDEMPLIR